MAQSLHRSAALAPWRRCRSSKIFDSHRPPSRLRLPARVLQPNWRIRQQCRSSRARHAREHYCLSLRAARPCRFGHQGGLHLKNTDNRETSRPGKDFSWLADIEVELRYEAVPRPKHHRIVSTERLVRLGLDLIRRGETGECLTLLARARLVRDGLMVALRALCPIGLGNFARLRLGEQIRLIGECWWIILKAPETKSDRPDDRPIPAILTEVLHRWVNVWRPVFHPTNDALWPSTKGGTLAYTYVGHILTETTR